MFCSAPDHHIQDCPIASEYRQQGKITHNEHGKVMLPNGRLPSHNSHNELGQNLQEKVDYFWEFQNIRTNDNQSCTQATTHSSKFRTSRASLLQCPVTTTSPTLPLQALKSRFKSSRLRSSRCRDPLDTSTPCHGIRTLHPKCLPLTSYLLQPST